MSSSAPKALKNALIAVSLRDLEAVLDESGRERTVVNEARARLRLLAAARREALVAPSDEER